MNTIIYRADDLDRSIITQQQVEQLNDYIVEFYENGNLIRAEEKCDNHTNEPFTLNVYYVQNGQTHTQLFNSVYNLGDEISIAEIKMYGGKKLESDFFYDVNGNLSIINISMYDENHKLIGSEIIEDIITRTPKFEKTRKTYYNAQLSKGGLPAFSVEFNENGDLSELRFDCFGYQNDEVILDSSPSSIAEIINLTGMSQNLAEWYLSNRVEPNTSTL